ncbi:methyltransferase domain-containing protein [Rubinisphaera brasiliensis]|uniref:Methyltransferase type 11 n=1 Tax=Rubinisphaera brasiliensis (strain ATCC 49424 / DSM 5305 / JCM 21570 / IAM 15109 / NBRC 103401 / IFAM 1448) TaxID=756272 RepID=F0SFW3_RUBBR|nr:methyltransferase domain-containing protein [Rubinisphaera brasiliensis]ADY61570.1 Methyltransferase type 11 [Rubinisphaera brasiliensis DSM 5305]
MWWKCKAMVLRKMSRLPGGRSAYLTAQKLLGTNRVAPRRDLTKAAELLDCIRDVGASLVNASVYEIGTGWHPFTPLAFFLAGAKEIITVDVNPWLSLRTAREAVAATGEHLDWFADRIGQDCEQIRERYSRIAQTATSQDELLASFGCRYIYPGDACQSGLADNSVQFVISSNVLEHIPGDILQQIFRESRRILSPGGLAVHRFNPGDHYANGDGSITNGNFLQFSEKDWQRYGGGLAYHNRLRSPQFAELFRETGLEQELFETRIDERTLKALEAGELQVHADYQRFSNEELAIDYVWYVGQKPETSTRSAEKCRSETTDQHSAEALQTVSEA